MGELHTACHEKDFAGKTGDVVARFEGDGFHGGGFSQRAGLMFGGECKREQVN